MDRNRLTFVPERAKPRWALRIACSIVLFAIAHLAARPVLRWIDRTTELNRHGENGSFSIAE